MVCILNPKITKATLENFIVQQRCFKNWRELCLCQERLHGRCTQLPPAWCLTCPAPPPTRSSRRSASGHVPMQGEAVVHVLLQQRTGRSFGDVPSTRDRGPRVNVPGRRTTYYVSPHSRQACWDPEAVMLGEERRPRYTCGCPLTSARRRTVTPAVKRKGPSMRFKVRALRTACFVIFANRVNSAMRAVYTCIHS